ncbi:MAG: sulfurtransferase [Hahellaceae bacterium]|nr:sulfurtransferase [Hahellaceae bacterium]
MIKVLSDIVSQAKANESCLTVAAALEVLGGCENPLLVDVREPQEYQLDAIQGFINIPRGVLEMRLPELCSDPQRCILIHCATGGRAALSARALREMGYENVHLINAPFAEIKAGFMANRQA